MEDAHPPATYRLEDIAKLARCSISTASRALKGSSVISPEMRSRVQEAAARLGYQTPARIRKPGRSKTRTVGIVLDVLQNNPFMTQLLEHLHVALYEAGYQVMLFMEPHVQRGTLPAAEPLIDDYLEGMIIGTASLSSPMVAELCLRGMPLVLVVRSDGSGKVDTVEIDNVHAGMEAARHLYELGHRRFAMVMGPQNTSTSRDRAQGALTYLDSVGVNRDAVLLSWGEYTSDSGYSATMALLSRPDPVTAIIAANDSVAMGVLEACKRHDVEVPGQVSVVGFDDIPLAGSPLIGLTTIRQPVESMARLAARRLIDRMQMRGPTPPAKDILPVHLVSRSSTGRPPTPNPSALSQRQEKV